MEEAIEKEKILKELCEKVGVDYHNTAWSVYAFIDFSRRCYEQGRKDAFLEIAYSDYVIKEPFEKLAYEKGIADERERIVDELEKEYKLAEEEKRRCASENQLQFDSAKGYSIGIYNAIEFVKGQQSEEI